MRRSLLLLGVLLAAGCGGSSTTLHGSGVATTSVRAVGRFTGVELAGVGTVVVRRGPTRVSVSGDDNIVPLVTTRVVGGTLVIGEQPGSFSTRSPLVVDVRAPSLEATILSGSGTLEAHGVAAGAFEARVSGAGTLTVDGDAGALTAAVSGTGTARLERLVARDAHVVLSGVGSAHVYATHSLDASLEGTGSIVYGGNPPLVSKRVTGLGSVAAD